MSLAATSVMPRPARSSSRTRSRFTVTVGMGMGVWVWVCGGAILVKPHAFMYRKVAWMRCRRLRSYGEGDAEGAMASLGGRHAACADGRWVAMAGWGGGKRPEKWKLG